MFTRRHFGALGLSALLPRMASAAAAKSDKPWLVLPPTPALPEPTRSDTMAINGTRIWFATFGQGPPVLFLHGGLGSSNYWALQVAEVAKTAMAIVMDTRGHGRSPVTSDKFGFALFAEDVAALLGHLGTARAAIVGWSDGAITGLQLATAKPDLVSRLFAFGANSNGAGLKPGGSKSPVFAAYAGRCQREYQKLSPDPARWAQLVTGMGAVWRREPNFSRAQLAAIKAPTTIADGAYDEIIARADTELMARTIPGARLKILPDASHFAMLQKPDDFNRALAEFLAG